jgi:hypothetical protein
MIVRDVYVNGVLVKAHGIFLIQSNIAVRVCANGCKLLIICVESLLPLSCLRLSLEVTLIKELGHRSYLWVGIQVGRSLVFFL